MKDKAKKNYVVGQEYKKRLFKRIKKKERNEGKVKITS